ncbi:MAG: 50S ribosomal protein L13 [Parachlamydiales bacterium]|nr:50S ribosomal protein L13 [Parachlamydiales bacterium]
MTTFITKEEAQNSHEWYLLDAKGKTLGRFASEIAKILRGKHKPRFTPHTDTGDGVIVLNAPMVKVTGAKEAQKNYYTHSGYVGGLKETSYRAMQQKHPEHIIEHAVWGMMPKTKLGRKQFKRLKVFRGDSHDMTAQKPIVCEI